MSGFSNPIVGGGGGLVYPSVHSPNFNPANPLASPSPSWGILKNGLAYFFGLVLSGGTIEGTDYIINASGAFFYNGTPTLGNLSQSITDSNGTDGFGNTYLQGITTYSPISGSVTGTLAVSSVDATLTFFYSTSTTGSGTYRQTGTMLCQPTVSNTGPNTWLMDLLDNTGSSVVVSVELDGTSGTPTMKLQQGALISLAGTITNPSLITTDTWHGATLTTPANWTVNNTLEYRLYPDNTVGLSGELTAQAAIATGASLTTLPTGYRPSNSARLTLSFNNGTSTVSTVLANVATNGVITTFPAIASGDTLNISARFALD